MAKKTVAKKNGKRKALQSKAQLKPAPKPRNKPKASAQVLPGMEQVRHTRLDALCESIGEARERAATAASDEAGDKRAALSYMHQEGVNAYHHAGVELVRVPGEEKLRVRVTDHGGATATMPSDAAPEKADDDDPPF